MKSKDSESPQNDILANDGEKEFLRIASAIQAYYPNPDLELVRKGFDFAFRLHKGQVRASGEPYVLHLIETALLACQMKLDLASVVAALLHDTVEDCATTKEEIYSLFGEQVSSIVDGVTKLTRIEFESKEERQAESFRKMLIAMAKDIRVVLVKLCDRLHNMRTLQHLPEAKRRFIAKETQDIYAPLANRLGIHWLKSELQDLCLLTLRPEIYKLIDDNFSAQHKEREAFISNTCFEIQKKLEESGISAAVKGRAKHYFSIWQKMEKDNLAFDEIHDLIGFRIIVPTRIACYEALGVIHDVWKPVPGRFKDFIAMPKPNMYQSLHTTVIGPSGSRVEVQMRTPQMNLIAEEGIAAHWRYKEQTGSTVNAQSASFDLNWVRELVETQQYLKNPDEFIQSVKGELFPEEVFIFTPGGDLIRLSHGATTVDFAYAVHTDVGHRAVGARVNGQMVSLDHALQNGDTVQILTNKNHVPSKDWLKFVKSTKAKQRIRAFLKTEEHARSLALGSDILSKDLKRAKLSLKKLEQSGKLSEVAQQMGYKSEGELYAAISYGKVSSAKVVAKLLPEGSSLAETVSKMESPIERIFKRAAQANREKVGVKVNGYEDVLVRFARCCEPLPGDRIVGFITRGRGVTVHFADCPQVLQADPLRRVVVAWDNEVQAPRRIHLNVVSQDQIGLLANLTKAITEHGANINSASIRTTPLGKALNAFELTVSSAEQLEKVRRAMEMVPGVIKVERVQGDIEDQ